MNNCADYSVLHGCIDKLWANICFYGNFWHQTYRFFYLFCQPLYVEFSRFTRNHWHSLDNVYSHKCCPSETCVYMLHKECVTPYHVTRVWFQIMAVVLGPFECLFFRLIQVAFWNKQTIKDFVSLCMEIPQTFAAIKNLTFIKLNSLLACLSYRGMSIIMAKIAVYKSFSTQLYNMNP